MIDVSPHALSNLEIDFYADLLEVDVHKNMDIVWLREKQTAAVLEAGEISKEDHEKWRCHYPEFDVTQKRTKVMSQGLSDLQVDEKKGE